MGELPRWMSMKTLQACKIDEICFGADGASSILRSTSHGVPFKIEVSSGYMRKHDPKIGGYYVQYGDGAPSYRSAEVFEASYTRI